MTAPLSKATLDELEERWRVLTDLIEPIAEVLRDNGREPGATPLPPRDIRLVGLTRPLTEPAQTITGTFRAAILDVLVGGRKAPREVTAALAARGYQYTGKTALGTRVGNEMYRMLKEGRLKKAGKRYALLEAKVGSANGHGANPVAAG